MPGIPINLFFDKEKQQTIQENKVKTRNLKGVFEGSEEPCNIEGQLEHSLLPSVGPIWAKSYGEFFDVKFIKNFFDSEEDMAEQVVKKV